MKLSSDLFGKPQRLSAKAHVETERSKIRSDIAEYTKPRRNAFLYKHKEYFQPLLPETSYIDRLQRTFDMENEEPVIVPYESITTQPRGITAIMKPYQLEGLSFMAYMTRNGMSSILGDEMGLGKTLQTIALMQHIHNSEPKGGETRPFLVVCPLSVLSSWMAELKKWAPGLRAVRFHGPKLERDKLKDECRVAGQGSDIDVVVTTYDTYAAEHTWFKRAFVWRYCVLDEGHKIKNDKSNVSQVLQGLQAEYRLLLTGTPLQNNLQEMWALLHWLYPEVFPVDTADKFKRAFDLTKGRVNTDFLDSARQLLELVMLRRMKNSPGVNLGLPPKEEVLLYVPLTPMQRFWYTRILTKSDKATLEELFESAKTKELQSRQIEADADEAQNALLQKAANELAGKGEAAESNDVWAESKEILEKAIEQEQQSDTNTSEWRKLMNLVMQLRKVCSHPYLMPNAAPEPYLLGDHIKTASGKFLVLDKLVKELVIKQSKKVVIFSGWTRTLDLCEDLLCTNGATAMKDAPFRYLRLDGGTARARRNLGIRMFNEATSDFKVMLVSTRAGGLGINLATSCSEVVFLDEDWNPQITLQAEARAHRIGQTKPVRVFHILTAGTVEEQMMGRIRKKLYLSAKITESMKNIHSAAEQGKKRKRASAAVEDDTPQLDTTSLKSLIRRGAQTLSRPEIDVTEMLDWDWETTLEKCKDKPADAQVAEDSAMDQEAEQSWLNTMEKVECAVFEGKKHQKEVEAAVRNAVELSRADRRVNKNTTVMIDGFAINKESLACADWEAVPTMAGKDPRLAEPVRAKKAAINNQEHCAVCWDGGSIVCCSGCPRSYHVNCLDKATQVRAKGKMQFYCPQHECVDCQGKTTNAGGMLYRCRWCERAYCEDCLDWDAVRLVGESLPEYEMLGYGATSNAWFVECPACVAHWAEAKGNKTWVEREEKWIQKQYEGWLEKKEKEEGVTAAPSSAPSAAPVAVGPGLAFAGARSKAIDLTADKLSDLDDTVVPTPGTQSEVWTPLDTDVEIVSRSGGRGRKEVKMF